MKGRTHSLSIDKIDPLDQSREPIKIASNKNSKNYHSTFSIPFDF
jgi:hypothetical protein